MTTLWFFVSYSTADEPAYVREFYDCMEKEVRSLAGGNEKDVGFLAGKDLKIGEEWPVELDRSLQITRVFLPLLSPAYLSSDYCGREWAAFRARLEAAGTPHPPLILPVLWTPLDLVGAVPAEVSDIQNKRLAFGEDYANEGMAYLMRLDGKKDERTRIIRDLARQLVTVAKRHPLPSLATPTRIKQLVSPWRQPEVGAVAPAPAVDPTGAGPRYVQFVFVAGKSDELEPLARSVDFYGNAAAEWKPYLPDLPDDIEWLTQQIAVDQRLRCRETLPPTPQLIAQIALAEQENRIVVIVVDTWSLQLASYRALMTEYDARRFGNALVLVPWNPQDAELRSKRAMLEVEVGRAFRRIKLDRSPNFLDAVSTFDDFRDTLSKALNRLKLELLATAPVLQTAQGGPATQPMLTVTGGPGR